jgi:hypothetical protein
MQWRNIVTTFDSIAETASELGQSAQDSIEDLRRTAGKKLQTAGKRLDRARDDTGDALHSAASSVRATGRQGAKAIDEFANGAADRLDDTASYIEDTDLRGMAGGIGSLARRYPVRCLVAAAAVGFWVGTAMTRKTPARRRS